MSVKSRAAIVVFVEVEDEFEHDSGDINYLFNIAMYKQEFERKILLGIKNRTVRLNIVNAMEVGMAIGNGYLWTEITNKAYKEHGIYTDKELKQLQDEEENEKRSEKE